MPPHVEYSLTERGKSLRDILVAMSDWGEELVAQQREEGADVEILNHNKDGFSNM